MSMRKIAEFGDSARLVKVHRISDTGEYRARLYIEGVANEKADYFDTDKKGCLATAEIMARAPHAIDRNAIKQYVAAIKAQAPRNTVTLSRNKREGKYGGYVCGLGHWRANFLHLMAISAWRK
jgi:hypothetical protein